MVKINIFRGDLTGISAKTATLAQIPNQKLMSSEIINLTRSKELTELYLFEVDLNTPVTVVQDVQRALQEALKHYPSDFTGKVQVDARSIANPLKYQLAVYVDFAFPGDDFRRLCAARGTLMTTIGRALTNAKARHSYMYHAVNYTSGEGPSIFDTIVEEEVVNPVKPLRCDGLSLRIE